MIFVMDIGNTNIKAAVYDGSRLLKRWRCVTDTAMTSDQYGIIMADLFRYHELDMKAIEGIMFSSVVPSINYTIEHMCRDYFHRDPRLLVPGMKTGLNIKYENPRELGSDRIANAVAVSSLYGVELLADNAAACRKRLFEQFSREYAKVTKNRIKEVYDRTHPRA